MRVSCTAEDNRRPAVCVTALQLPCETLHSAAAVVASLSQLLARSNSAPQEHGTGRTAGADSKGELDSCRLKGSSGSSSVRWCLALVQSKSVTRRVRRKTRRVLPAVGHGGGSRASEQWGPSLASRVLPESHCQSPVPVPVPAAGWPCAPIACVPHCLCVSCTARCCCWLTESMTLRLPA